MKKIISSVLTIVTIITSLSVPAYAKYEPPKEIWASFNEYAKAIENKDYENIIKYGLIDLSILEKEPENETTLSWKCARYQNIAQAYEKLGDYQNSAIMYEKQIPFAKKIGWYDSEKIARAKTLNYKSYIELYTKTSEPQVYFGAKNEHQMGVLYGLPADSPTDQSNCSMKLIYLEFGDTNFDWIKSELKTANEKSMAVEFALNMPNQGNDIPKVISDNQYLKNLATMLSNYPNIKYFVRFGAEFDIWETKTTPQEFKQAFIKTADIIHKNVPNAAMVFSPNMVSSWDIDIMDYYPGDEYVDWIGLSLYLMKYFQGVANRSDDQKYLEVVFATGDSAEPVLMLKKFVDLFGDRKPIMISESGSSHYILTQNEDATEWALDRMKKMYEYLPIVYPQIKLIAHFDTFIKGEINNYSLRDNQRIKNLWFELTKDDIFIKKNALNSANYNYKKLDNTIYTDGSIMEINTYAHVFGEDNLKVNYYLDGKWVASSNTIPYTANLDLSSCRNGDHTLRVTIEADGEEKYSKTYTLKGTGTAVNNDEIKVLIDNVQLSFEKAPVIIDGRTLVPMRAIFEALGAEVDWIKETKTAVANKDGIRMSISINSNQMIINDNVIEIDVPAKLIDEKTMVPVRAVTEGFNAKVDWDNENRTVIINTLK